MAIAVDDADPFFFFWVCKPQKEETSSERKKKVYVSRNPMHARRGKRIKQNNKRKPQKEPKRETD